jgi:hypothetical protein
MTRLLRKLSGGAAGEGSVSLLFFALYYLYLWLAVDLRLIYHDGGVALDFPVFYREWEFFRGFLSYPGGLVDYASAFLAQFFYIGWAGALIATIQAWLMWVLALSVMRAACGRSFKAVCFVLPLLMLGYYAEYTYPLDVAMTVLTAMCFTRLYLSPASKSNIAGLLVFSLLSVILYAIAGAGYLLFIAVCGLYELLLRRRLAMGLAFLLGGLTVAHIEGMVVFDFSVTRIFGYFTPGSYVEHKGIFVLVCILYLLLPLTLACSWGSQSLRMQWRDRLDQITASLTGKYRWMRSSLIPIVAVAMVGLFCHNNALQAEMAASYYGCNGMWRKVLEIASRHPESKMINHLADRALYNTGRLTQDMFKYEQHPNALMLTNEEEPATWFRLPDTYIELGHMNFAESLLTLAMDAYGERPVFLKRLALINMVKGNTGAAKVYLGALSRTLFEAGWAKVYLEKIERDPNLSTDEEVQHLRSIMPETDRDFKSLKNNIFQDLLARNRNNKMAFEYSEVNYLLTHQIDKFIETLTTRSLKDFDYSGIPRVYEEAILTYNMVKKKNFELPGRKISVESRERFDSFCNVLRTRYGGDKNLAFDALAKDYGDSYFFYALYGYSGIKK